MASRRPLTWISGALAELPVGDTVAGHAWYFGSGEPNAAAGAVGEYYVEANNRLWVKDASAWTYTGVQLGSAANVVGKVVLVDADVISVGDSANSLQMRQVTIADFKTQFLSASLTDAAASPDLPAAGSVLGWPAIVQTLRNGVKWLTSRFNSAGQLAPVYGGTGTNDLANLPISTATQEALATKVTLGYANTYPASTEVIGDANSPSGAWTQVSPQTLNGPGNYSLLHTLTTQAGTLTPSVGVWLTQLAYGTDPTAPVFIRNSTNGAVYGPWRTQIASAPDSETQLGPAAFTPLLRTDTNLTGYGSFTYPAIVIGDGQYGVYVESGALRFRCGNAYSFLNSAGNWCLPGDARTVYGPNSTWGGVLEVGSGNWGSTDSGAARVNVTNGNLHVDAEASSRVYLNFYRGQGVIFGNGQTNTVAEVTATGEWNGTNVHARQDNAYEIGSTNARFAVAYFGSNPIVTSDRRWKTDLGTTLGLDFVLALRPQSYRLMDAKVTVITEPDGYEDVQEQLYETRQVVGTEIVVVGGKPVRKTVEREEHVPVFDLLPVTDEHGEAVLDEGGQPVMHPVPRMRTVRRGKTRQVRSVSEGVRRHHGLLAQQVLEVLQAQGLTSLDFAGLIRDEEADTWGLRYEQFIAPLISAVQTQAQQIAQLKGQVDRLLSGGAQQ